MPRPRRFRRISHLPGITYFKPAGVPFRNLEEVVLTFDELEALRLTYHTGLDQIETAKRMNISQPTLSRLLSSGREKLVKAIIEGKALKIEGGSYKFAP